VKTKFMAVIALMFCMGVLFFSTAVYASPSGADATTIAAATPGAEPLTVKSVTMEGNTIHVTVADANTGVDQTLDLNLQDYADTGSEYVSIQAIDRSGNKSNTVQFKNPYYVAATDTPVTGNAGSPVAASPTSAANGQPKSTGTGTTSGQQPFTPDGSGTVMDNVQNSDGKEFYSIKSANGNVFYLIVDKQRTADNVYLLDAVDENDLSALAKPTGGAAASAAPTIAPQIATPTPTAFASAPVTPPVKNGGSNTGMIIFVVIAVIAVGGAGYYFKIVRPKQQSSGADSSEDDEYDSDEDSGDSEADDDVEYENTDDGEDDKE